MARKRKRHISERKRQSYFVSRQHVSMLKQFTGNGLSFATRNIATVVCRDRNINRYVEPA